MSAESTNETSEAETTDTATSEPVDGQLGDAGKKALQALRAEVKDLKAELAKAKATESADAGTGDPASDSDSPSDGTRDATNDEKPERMPISEYKALSLTEKQEVIRLGTAPRFTDTGDGAQCANPRMPSRS